uniref:All-trans retinoic acid induced differentiation factor n=1 Tax=Hypotaenidia okinawae TaxID=2861861 RepID=A0A6G1RFG9_9GRUI
MHPVCLQGPDGERPDVSPGRFLAGLHPPAAPRSDTATGVPGGEQRLGGGHEEREQTALPGPEEPLQQLRGPRYGGGAAFPVLCDRGLTRPRDCPLSPAAWPCPENAACVPDGPGLVQCLCQGPFHGYKCLREGTFPVLLFCGILGAVTVSLSLLLWGTQRRKVKSPWDGRGVPYPGGLRVPGSGSRGGSWG